MVATTSQTDPFFVIQIRTIDIIERMWANGAPDIERCEIHFRELNWVYHHNSVRTKVFDKIDACSAAAATSSPSHC